MIVPGPYTETLILPLTEKRKKHFQQIYSFFLLNISPLINLEYAINVEKAQ